MSAPNTHFGAPEIARMLRGVDAVYFLGIGGVSVSSLARMTMDKGLRVGGYDRSSSSVTEKLRERGARVYHTPDAAHLDGFGAVVYTVAISPEHEEYREAQRRGLPLISRSDYMGYLMMDYAVRVGVAGSHGKSTVTCMCARIWMSAAADPTVLSGASMRAMGGAFLPGGRESMIFEACEYKDSFLDFNPTVAVVLNAELDHVDYFHSMQQLRDSFAAFAERVGQTGVVISNADDEQTVKALSDITVRRVTFGRGEGADYRATNISVLRGFARFTLEHRGTYVTDVVLRVPGEHNVYNALAAAAAALECGLSAESVKRGLECFEGAQRRMEYKGRLGGAVVYDDYAHHPTEVEATLREAALLGEGRLVAVFQPHTYSRTQTLFEKYVKALQLADAMLVAPIYAARETDDRGVSAHTLAEAVPGGKAKGFDRIEDVAAELCRTVRPEDTIIIMGAGDIDGIYAQLPLETDVSGQE